MADVGDAAEEEGEREMAELFDKLARCFPFFPLPPPLLRDPRDVAGRVSSNHAIPLDMIYPIIRIIDTRRTEVSKRIAPMIIARVGLSERLLIISTIIQL